MAEIGTGKNETVAGERMYLSELLGTRATVVGKRIGKLADLIAVDRDRFAEVTHVCVARPFGERALVVPWEKVRSLSADEMALDISDLKPYEADEVPSGALLLKDHILDKKVIDINDTEVEVVYDLVLVKTHNKLIVTSVDLSRFGRMRRIGFRRSADRGASREETPTSEMIPWLYVAPLSPSLSSFKGEIKLKVLREKLAEVQPVDLADMIEELDREQRMYFFNQLDTVTASDTLEEIDPNVQRELVPYISMEQMSLLINQMSPGQAADFLSALPASDASELIELLNKETKGKVRSIMEKQEEHAINYATQHFVRITPDITVEQAQNQYHVMAKNQDIVMYLYIVDADGRLLGVIDIKELLAASDTALIKNVMVTNVISLRPESTLKEAYELFNRYEFRAIPIVDGEEKIVGVVTFRDVMRLTHHFIE
ncbi:MAG TPA: CBS domain-containing protein [Methanomassiliicoccales archaeon]|nr:CBS domain-containing protein [Methanomassiliicoccales archaeon]